MATSRERYGGIDVSKDRLNEQKAWQEQMEILTTLNAMMRDQQPFGCSYSPFQPSKKQQLPRQTRQLLHVIDPV